MHNLKDSSDPLLQAIAELDGAVDRLIDEQIAYLNAADVEDMIPRASQPSVRLRRFTEASTDENSARPAPAPASAHTLTQMDRAAAPTARADDDPKQRLDALARHLDDRLRRERKGANPAVNP